MSSAETELHERHLANLEQQAGISSDTAKLYENWNSFSRLKLRNLYFAIEDNKLRLDLLKTQNRLHKLFEDSLEKDVSEARQKLAWAITETENFRDSIALAAFLAGASAAVGSYFGSVEETIICATFGSFLGLGVVLNHWSDKRQKARLAQEALDYEIRTNADILKRHPPAPFSIDETETGRRDKEWDWPQDDRQ